MNSLEKVLIGYEYQESESAYQELLTRIRVKRLRKQREIKQKISK